MAQPTFMKGLLCFCMGSVLLLTGCASSGDISHTGPGQNFPHYQPEVREPQEARLLRRQHFFVYDYSKLYVDPVEFIFEDGIDQPVIDERDLTLLKIKFYTNLREQLRDQYALVNKPGPGVLRVKTLISQIKPSEINVRALPQTVLKHPVNVSEARLEARFLDSQSNEHLATFIDGQAGKELEPLSVVSEWQEAEQAMKYWASLLRQSLEKERPPSIDVQTVLKKP